jgi:hypothetical protein
MSACGRSGPGADAVRGSVEQNVLFHFLVQATPMLRERLCAANTCNEDGVPVELPKPRLQERTLSAGASHLQRRRPRLQRGRQPQCEPTCAKPSASKRLR